MILDARTDDYKYVVKDANGVRLDYVISCDTTTGRLRRQKRNPDGSLACHPQSEALLEEIVYVPAPLQVFLNDRRVF